MATHQIIKEPIYQQLNKVLRQLIENDYKLGDKFLTERDICKRFEVSRATANKALSNLVSEGILEFRKGVGTFIRQQVLNYNLHSLVSFTNTAKNASKVPSTQVLRFDRIRGKEIDDINGLSFPVEANEDYFVTDRLRCADGLPVIYEHRYIAARLCPDLNDEDLAGSLYSVLADRYKLNIIGSDEIIRSIGIATQAARVLKVRTNTAGFLIIAIGYIEGRVPLWWERSVFRGDVYELHNSLGPMSMANSTLTAFLDFRQT